MSDQEQAEPEQPVLPKQMETPAVIHLPPSKEVPKPDRPALPEKLFTVEWEEGS